MAFQNSLTNLITDFDEHNNLWRALMQSVHDHGGGTRHLNGLLSDAKGPRLLVDEIAKLMIGKIWQLAEQRVDLGLDEYSNFECPAKEFLSRYPNLKIHPGVVEQFERGQWSETAPKEPCEYQLLHFRQPPLFSEVVSEPGPYRNPTEHASWRELIAYVSRMKWDDFCGCRILAAGSRNLTYDSTQKRKVEGPIFPCVDGFEDGISVGWKGVKRPETEKFEVNCFYLIRVYD